MMEDEEPQRSSTHNAPKTSWGEDPPAWLVLISLVLSPVGLFLVWVGLSGSSYGFLNFFFAGKFPPSFLDWFISDWVISQFDQSKFPFAPRSNPDARGWAVVALMFTDTNFLSTIKLFFIWIAGLFVLIPVRVFPPAYYERRWGNINIDEISATSESEEDLDEG